LKAIKMMETNNPMDEPYNIRSSHLVLGRFAQVMQEFRGVRVYKTHR